MLSSQKTLKRNYRKQLNLYYPAAMSHFKEFFELQFDLQLQQQLISH
ncbi:hypothetical protein Niako_7167 [Niastella koreensis GR20-10]|uniref:Uncharacterized protein n=1 Tax=Niastella koreensis (strain DSM 17620 / KACC 11465 / NBRC 106392 / GR20-10) TaxID=700598 RepID=G8T7U0_NIAKG|nr:hypothetical protein Niako_7167 [Niastella koreensis GR20-10]